MTDTPFASGPGSDLRRGDLLWADLDPTRGREQAGRRPVLVIASDLYLTAADTLAIVVPCSTVDRGWPNHVPVRGPRTGLTQQTFAMTEQPRTVTRDRLAGRLGQADEDTMADVDRWLRDFLALP